MKTLFRIAFALLLVAGLNQAVQAQFELGAGATLGFNFDEFGIQARAQYGFTDTWRAAGSFSYFFVGEGVTANIIDLNAHYRLSQKGNLQPYVLAGLGIATYKVNVNTGIINLGNIGVTNTGFNVGGGANLAVGKNKLFGEAQFGIGGAELGIVAGILFSL